MPTTILKFTYSKTDLLEIVDAWAQENGYKANSTDQNSRLLQRGSAVGINAPAKVSVKQDGQTVEISCWLEAFAGVAIMDINPGNFIGAVPKSINRKRVNKLLARLGQPPITRGTAVEKSATNAKGSRKTTLFGHIGSLQEAESAVADIAKGFYFLAGLQIIVGLLVLPGAIIDGVVYGVLAYLLQKFKSRVVAVALLVLAVLSIIITFANLLGADIGGRNIFLAIIVVVISIRAVQATFVLHQKRSNAT